MLLSAVSNDVATLCCNDFVGVAQMNAWWLRRVEKNARRQWQHDDDVGVATTTIKRVKRVDEKKESIGMTAKN